MTDVVSEFEALARDEEGQMRRALADVAVGDDLGALVLQQFFADRNEITLRQAMEEVLMTTAPDPTTTILLRADLVMLAAALLQSHSMVFDEDGAVRFVKRNSSPSVA